VRTALIIVIGFAFLGACLLAPRLLGRPEATGTAAKIFLVLWLVAALANGWLGVRAGYTWAQELPISLVIFIVPGALAAYVWWKYAST
jgi:hypothetical protein